jgi:hypothetical protein
MAGAYRDMSFRQPQGQGEGVDDGASWEAKYKRGDVDYATYMQRKKLYDPNYWKRQEEKDIEDERMNKMSRQMRATSLGESYKKFNEGTRLREMKAGVDAEADYLSTQLRQKAVNDAMRRLYNPGLPEGQ